MSLTTSRPFRILAVCLVPLVGAGVLVWSTSNRQQRIDKVPVAVVNNDKIITGSQPMAAGRALTSALTEPSKPDKNLHWTVTDSDDAKEGLADGDFYAVLTIPTDFSKAILSSGGDKPTRGQLSLVSNSAASVTVPYISEKVASAAADSLGVQTTQGYLKNVYQGFNQIASSNKKSASSASQLADGTGQLSSGAGHLDSGASGLAASLVQLQTGASQLQSGAAGVQSGADSVASGAGKLSRGTGNVASGASKLHQGTKKLAGSADTLAGSSKRLARGAGGVAAGASGLASADFRLAKADRLLAAELAVLSRLCGPAGAGDRFCAAVGRAHQHALTLAGAAQGLAGRSASLAGASHGVATGTRKLAHGNQQLASGARKLAGSSANLSQGAHSVHSGAVSVASGASSVASGAASVNQAAGSLATGTGKAASGGASVASGASSVNSSAGSVNHGAGQLSSGLAKGAKESPTYSSSLQKSLENTVSQPVNLSHSLQHDKHGNGWLMAALVALVLWLVAVAGALRAHPGTSLRETAAPVSSRRLAFSRLVPVLALAVVEAAGVLVALLLLNVSAADVVGFVVMTVVAALTFTAVAFATRLMLGGAGIAALVVVLLLQVAALGNVIPLQTAPGPLRTLNAVLPLPAYVDSASQLLTGGSVGNRAVDLVVLLAWGAVACVATVLTVRRRRLEPSHAPPPRVPATPATPVPV